MIDLSLIKITPADESHREFSYQVKKVAYRDYITQIWGWDEEVQRDFHAKDWQDKRPKIITYAGEPIGTILTVKNENYIEIWQFYLLPEYQNKGIGSYILKGILNEADRSGLVIKVMYLTINRAASLYSRMGFEVIGADGPFTLTERKPGGTA